MRFIAFVLCAVLVLAQTAPVNKVPNFYVDAEHDNQLVYCATGAEHPGCACSDPNTIYSNGFCVPAETMCEDVPVGLSYASSCGDFGSNTRYCKAISESEVSLVSESNCFNHADVPVGQAVAELKISFTNMPVSAFTPLTKVNIIYGLVNVFPFAIGDIEIGSVYSTSEGSTILNTVAPTTILEVRITTTPGYENTFLNAEESRNSSAGDQLAEYLRRISDSIFNDAIEIAFDYVNFYAQEGSCTRDEVTYSLSDVIYTECGEGFIGHQFEKCSVIDGAADWSAINRKDCLQVAPEEGSTEHYIDFVIRFRNLDATFVNCNLTLEFFPVFVEFAHTKLNDLIVFDVYPVPDENASITDIRIRYTVPEGQYHEEGKGSIAKALYDQLAVYTVENADMSYFKEKFQEIDRNRFSDSVSYSIHDLTYDGAAAAPSA